MSPSLGAVVAEALRATLSSSEVLYFAGYRALLVPRLNSIPESVFEDTSAAMRCAAFRDTSASLASAQIADSEHLCDGVTAAK